MHVVEELNRIQKETPRFGRFAALHVVIVVAFLGLLYGAYRASQSRYLSENHSKIFSNGTATFLPTTILISLDGFRADFLQRDITPTLNSLVRSGVSPQYMNPSFPSLTFPNHFTLVTGLYPESHGIVGNSFWDPETQEEFYYTDPARSMQPEWWQAEPLWETAELAGVKSAIHMWPGSEAHIDSIEPAYVDKYNGSEELGKKVDRILGLLDLPGPGDIGAMEDRPRPQLIAAYVPNVDADGHLYGPNSTEIRSTISSADSMLGDLFAGLEERNLTDIVNIVVVSDHGMATTSTHRLIQLEDLIDTSEIEHIDGWPLYGLRPKDTSEETLMRLYNTLSAESGQPKYEGAFNVYLRDRDMPERYNFANNFRIAPLWIVPNVGWAIVTREEFDVADGQHRELVYTPRGLHGYDHEHPLMRAIFIARGPAFPHTPGNMVEPFQNIEVYNIVCDSLGLEPKPNNGTLRLPLKPVGRHDEAPPAEIPEDPALEVEASISNANLNAAFGIATAPAEPSTISSSNANLNAGASFGIATAPSEPSTLPMAAHPSLATAQDGSLLITTAADGSLPQPTRPVVQDGDDEGEFGEDQNLNSHYAEHWWGWFKGKFDGLKDWVSDVFGSADGRNGTAAAVTGADGSIVTVTKEAGA